MTTTTKYTHRQPASHETDIHAYVQLIEGRITEQLDREYPFNDEGVEWESATHMEEGQVLECRELTELDGSLGRVDVLWGFSGPNIWLTWDKRWGSKLFHSWGHHPHTGESCREWEFDNGLAERYLEEVLGLDVM